MTPVLWLVSERLEADIAAWRGTTHVYTLRIGNTKFELEQVLQGNYLPCGNSSCGPLGLGWSSWDPRVHGRDGRRRHFSS
jgi:hypothetical protein